MTLRYIGAGLLLALTGCGQPSQNGLAEESYFPPLGLGQEAAALVSRRKPVAIKRHPEPQLQTQMTNTETPLENIEFEDEVTFSASPRTTQPVLPAIQTAQPRFAPNTALTRH